LTDGSRAEKNKRKVSRNAAHEKPGGKRTQVRAVSWEKGKGSLLKGKERRRVLEVRKIEKAP